MYDVTAMRLCDEKDSLHGRVFFCEKNAVRIVSQINRNLAAEEIEDTLLTSKEVF